ncbi:MULTISPECIES: ATP-binding protein [Deefgea]|uniref:histidine kinase n=1 Tax=Deefgea chitinilytica TaxID=570276 RepID=A0ABS2C923_9NEIS|nr:MULTISPECIES: ATP-binding protein [Deefgea]MBM5569978.1 response regulator [Deefgea chitinilytica]MBM9887207.1 response regulator [Deefgea sp. CFH1-16]
MPETLDSLLTQLAHYRRHNFDQARQLAERLVAFAQQEQNEEVLAQALFLLGESLEKTGEFILAREILEQAEAQAKKLNLVSILLDIYECLGKAYYTLGDLNSALSTWGHCLELALDQHSIVHYIKAYVGIGGVYLYFGMVEESLRHHQIAYEYVQELDDPQLLMMLHLWLGSDYQQLGQHQQALHHLAQCRALYSQTNDVGVMSEAIMHSGFAYLGLGQYSEAKQYFYQTITLSQRHHHSWSITMAQLGLAEVLLMQGEMQAALIESQKALELARHGGSQHQEMKACKIQSAVYESMGQFELALNLYERHTELSIQLAKERTFTQIESSTMRKISRMEMRLKLLKAEQQKKNILDESIRQQAEHLAEKNTLIAINQAKSDFLALISHEIRTPLSGVIGMLRLASSQKDLRPATRSQVRMGLENAELLLDIINDILDVSKIEAGKLSIESIPFDLLKLLHQVVDFFAVRAEEKGISFVLKLDHFSPTGCLGDPMRIRQILFNLIGNSIKFTEHGCVTITAYRDSEQVKILISDTGIGMDDQTIGRLFQKFEQADTSTTRKYGGTGLGLSISRGLVELMHGSLGVTSAPGEGSHFRIEIPLPVAEVPAEVAPSELPIQSLSHQIRVLYAEDIQTNQLIVGALLEEMNLSLHIVENGLEALEALAKTPFDVVLMDWRMPIMDGMTATRLIRAGGNLQYKVLDSEVYVIALTANATEKEKQEGAAAGMNDYLTKPVSVRELHDALSKAIRFQLARGADLPVMPTSFQFNAVKQAKTTSIEKAWITQLSDRGVAVEDALDRLNGNEQRYQRWLHHFFIENSAFFDALAQQKSIEQLDQYIAQVHAMRGVSGTLGLMDFYTLASDLEQNLFMAQKQGATELPDFSELELAWRSAKRFILPLVSIAPQDEPPKPIQGLLPTSSLPSLINLQTALQSNSLRARKMLSLVLQELSDEQKNLLNEVATKLEVLDYPAALLALNQRMPKVTEGSTHG